MMSEDLFGETEVGTTEHDTAPTVPYIVHHPQNGDPEDWEEEWFEAPTTLLDKRDSWTDDLDRLSRGLCVTPSPRPRRIPS